MNCSISAERPVSHLTQHTYKRINGYIYQSQSILGKGNFSTVYKGIHEITNQQFAIKVVQLASLTCNKLEQLLDQEISIIRGLSHRNIIQCIEVLKSVNNCYIITELCEGGTLEKTIKQKGSFNEGQIWQYVLDIYQGLKYLIQRSIVHRDLKPANIFIKDKTLKIADFGFAKQIKCLFQDCNIGSPLYMTPQGYIHSIYGPKTDLWSLGVIIFELLHGYPPLVNCPNQEDFKHRIAIEIHDSQFHPNISPQVKHLIKRCLEVDESKRISFQQLQANNFFQKYVIRRSLSISKPNLQLTRRHSTIDLHQRGQLPARRNTLLNMPQTNNMSIKRICLRDTKQNINTVRFRFNQYQQTSLRNSRLQENTLQYPTTRQPQPQISQIFQKHYPLVFANQLETTQNVSFSLKYSIIVGEVTYNEAIGLIHYCRIGFKLIPFLQNPNLITTSKSIIIKLLQQINLKLLNRSIKITNEQNKNNKQQKLKLVLQQYKQKYDKLMIGQIIPSIQPKSLHQQLQSFLSSCQSSLNLTTVYSTYLTFLFTLYTKLLIDSSVSGSYFYFGENGYIDSCLSQNVKHYSISDYQYQKGRFNQHYNIYRQHLL